MNNLKETFRLQLENRLQFIIGFTQFCLQKENPFLWVLAIIVSVLQKVAIIDLASLLNSFNNQQGNTQDLELLFKLCVPTIYLAEYLDANYLVACQGVLIVILMVPATLVGVSMSDEITFFKQTKFKNKRQLNISQSDNLSDCIQIMHQIYNQNSYIEGFQHRLMSDQSNTSLQIIRLRQIAIFLNYFPHVFAIPILYLLLQINMVLDNASPTLQIVGQILNVILAIQTIFITSLSLMWCQVSFTLNEANFLRLRFSYLQWIHFSLCIIPIVVSYAYTRSGSTVSEVDFVHTTNLIFVILAFLTDALDAYLTLPYVQKFKYSTNIFMRAIVMCITFFHILKLDDQQIICLTFIVSPCLSRLFIVLQDSRIEKVLTSTLKKEKAMQIAIVPQIMQQQTVLTHESEQNLRIESENVKYKDFQSNMIKQYDMSYFIHFIRVVQLMGLTEIGVLTRNSGVHLVNQRSKILMVCIILLRTHTENCNNTYCFCRGLKGEKRKIIEKHEIVKEMRMYDDFRILNIQFYVELIMRYLRDYAKLVFQTEIRKAHPNIIYLIQILVFLCNSDECYQAQLQILDLKHLLEKESTLQQKLAFELLRSYSKYQILHRFKEDITRQSIELTLKYEDYRYTELERDRLLKMVFNNILKKKQFLQKLNEDSHTYESLEDLYLQLNAQNCKVQKELEYFNLYSPGRTSLYCYMFYCLEVTNNYDHFIKLCNLINTRESKFFEYPAFYYKTEEQSYKVGYLLLNLTQSRTKRGEILSFSKNFPAFVGYSQEEFKQQVRLLDQLCYPSLIRAHDEWVEMFVLTNRPMIFRQPLPLLTQQKIPGLLCYLEIFIDICFNFSSNVLPSYCFTKEIKQGIRQNGLSGFILLDSRQIIEGVTENALECFEVQLGSLIGKSINAFIPSFQQLEAQLIHYLNEYLKETGSDATLTTVNKLVQHFTVQQESVEMLFNQETKYQLDLEIQMSYSMVNRIAFKSYLLKIRSPYKLGAVCSDESPLSKSLDEYSSEFDGVRLKEYILPGAGDNDIPQFTTQPDPITLRSQMMPHDQEHQPLQQQEFLCSDHHEVMSKQDSSEKDLDSPEQPHKQIYINSISSNSSKQSEIQRILIKSHFYRKFAEMLSKPKLLYVLFTINLFSLLAILAFETASTIIYANWQSNIRSNIYILQAFTMTSYSRATMQGTMVLIQYVQQSQNLSDYGINYIFNATQLTQLQTVLDANIEIFSSKMDEYSENSIIREVFSTIDFEQLDIFDNVDKTVKGWTALFQLIYMIQSLHIEGTTDTFQFLKSILYLLRSYSKYKDAYSQLNQRFTGEINNILALQDDTTDYISFVFLAIYILYFLTVHLLQFSYSQLCKKYLRCSEQISHPTIESELIHMSQLATTNLEVMYQNIQQFDIYEYHFSLKDKFHSEEEEKQNQKSTIGPNSSTNNKPKKFIKIQGQWNWKRQLTFLIHLISFSIALIVFMLIRANDKSQINDLISKLATYQQCITFTESLSEACLTNFILQSSEYLVEQGFIDDTDPGQMFIYTNESYTIANSILSEVLYSTGTVSDELKTLFASNVCKVVNEPDICLTVNNGELTQGLLLPSQELFSIIRENIDLYQMSGHATQMLQLSDMLSESFLIDAVTDFVDTVRQTVEDGIIAANNVKVTITVLFYIFIILINSFQIYSIYSYATQKLWGIRQFVYLLPPKALYNEDSFYKTLTYLLKIENQILYF